MVFPNDTFFNKDISTLSRNDAPTYSTHSTSEFFLVKNTTNKINIKLLPSFVTVHNGRVWSWDALSTLWKYVSSHSRLLSKILFTFSSFGASLISEMCWLSDRRYKKTVFPKYLKVNKDKYKQNKIQTVERNKVYARNTCKISSSFSPRIWVKVLIGNFIFLINRVQTSATDAQYHFPDRGWNTRCFKSSLFPITTSYSDLWAFRLMHFDWNPWNKLECWDAMAIWPPMPGFIIFNFRDGE